MKKEIYQCDVCSKQSDNWHDGWREVYWFRGDALYGIGNRNIDEKVILCDKCHHSLKKVIESDLEIVKLQNLLDAANQKFRKVEDFIEKWKEI